VAWWRRALGPLKRGTKRMVAPMLKRGHGDEEGSESALEQLYNLKAYVPQAIKFPLKISLGRVLVWAIEQRNRRHGGSDVAAELDRQVFQFFEEGGDLESWQRATEAARIEEPPPRSRAAG